MRAYRAIFSARFRVLLQYRLAAAAGFGTQLFWGLIKVMIFEAFYEAATKGPMPMRFEEVVAYVWLGQATLAALPWNVDRELAAMIRGGGVLYELLRPVDLYNQWFCRTLALRTAPTLMRAAPMFVTATAILPLLGAERWALATPTPAALAGWVAVMLGAIVLGVAMTTIWNISMMWTLSSEGATHLAPALVTIFSGMVIPLPLFPDWAQGALRLSPFAGLLDLPARVFIGHIAPQDVGGVLLQQLGWAFVLVVVGRWMLRRGVRQLVVQGG